MIKALNLAALATILLLRFLAGCSPPDERLVEISRQSMERQAEQNRQIAQQSQHITQASGEMVQAEAKARQDLIEMQRQLAESEGLARQQLLKVQGDLVQRDAQSRQELNQLQQDVHAASREERKRLDDQRQSLETERRQIAQDRQRAPVIAAAITQVGLLLLCALPLAVCVYLLYVLRHSAPQDDALTELLIEELAAEHPRLLPTSSRPALAPPRSETAEQEPEDPQVPPDDAYPWEPFPDTNPDKETT